jgi:hypothetical protein
MFFKLQLVMFFEGIRSERRLMRHAADRLSVNTVDICWQVFKAAFYQLKASQN